MKQGNIVLYTGEATDHIHMCILELAKFFRIYTEKVVVINFSENNWSDKLLKAMQEGIYFSIGFNGVGLGLRLAQGGYLCEKADWLHVAMLVDAPYNKWTADLHVPCNNLVVTYLDKSHLWSLKQEFPYAKMGMFMPWGGIETLSFEKIFSGKRDLDVVYCAKFCGMPDKSWQNNNCSVFVQNLLNEVVAYMEEFPVTVYDAMKKILLLHGLEDTEWLRKIYPYFWDVFWYIKRYRRLMCMKIAIESGVRVDAYGAHWEEAPFADKICVHGHCSYRESLNIYHRAKIVLQENAEFNQGAHDRVFNAMLHGAAVVSEYSNYLNEIFVEDIDISFYNWQNPEKMICSINEFLEDENKRVATAKHAYEKVKESHTWKNRAAQILQMVALWHESKKEGVNSI